MLIVTIRGNTYTLCVPNAEFQYIKAGSTDRITGLERANVAVPVSDDDRM